MDNDLAKQKYTFHVKGMHCQSCVLLIEEELKTNPAISSIEVDLKNCRAEVVGEFGEKTESEIASHLSSMIDKKGYEFTVEKEDRNKNWADFKIVLPITLVVILIFFLLQKAGLVNLIGSGNISYSTIFLIGIVASLSSCMAIVGGLLLSLSATFARSGDKIKPQVLFHLGRIVSFFVLGGLLGLLGSALTLSSTASFILGLVVALIMLLLGLNLLDIFGWTKHLTPAMPKFISKHALGVSKLNHSLTPFLVGLTTFFLPCGFTQSMQIFALSSGSFLSGGLSMLVFALGTLPVLALISFSSVGFKDPKKSRIFFRTAGLIVVFFALLNLLNALVIMGWLPPFINY